MAAIIPVATPIIGRPDNRHSKERDAYGHARLPASAHDATPKRVDKIPYGRFAAPPSRTGSSSPTGSLAKLGGSTGPLPNPPPKPPASG